MKREDIQYRGYRIIANASGARIHPQNHPIDGNSTEESLANAKAHIDAIHKEKQKLRPAPHIGTFDDYVEALTASMPADHECAMLSAHYKSEGKRLTAAELAKSAGWDSFSSANRFYGKLGKRIADQVGLDLTGRDEQAWTEALATFDEETRQWIMHDNLAKALVHLNMV
ncbi:hypothetical protein N9W89_08120 [Hellea sp.]|nr:hypothetical protein [Hellea sp.]